MENQMFFRRCELKYLLSRKQQEKLLRAMDGKMVPDHFAHSSIRNLYYDTPNYRIIRESIEKPIYKEKIRIRSYGPVAPEGLVYVELKKKYNSVVYKRRTQMSLQDAMEGLSGFAPLPQSQVGRELRAARDFYGNLSPKVFLSYERDSFCSREDPDFRMTFDDRILFRRKYLTLDTDCWGTTLLDDDTVLMELKLTDAIPLWLTRELSALDIRQASFSKYGTAYRHIFEDNQKGVLLYA